MRDYDQILKDAYFNLVRTPPKDSSTIPEDKMNEFVRIMQDRTENYGFIAALQSPRKWVRAWWTHKRYTADKAPRLLEALAQLHNTKQKDGSVSLDDIVALRNLPEDELYPGSFNRNAALVLANECGYIKTAEVFGIAREAEKDLCEVMIAYFDALPIHEIADEKGVVLLRSAIQAVEKASLKRVDIEKILFSQGKEAFQRGEFESASFLLGTLAAYQPKTAWAHYYLGKTFHALDETEKAKKHFGTAVQLRPAFATKDYEEATLYVAQGKYKEGLWAAERAAEVAWYSGQGSRSDVTKVLNEIGIAYKDGKKIARNFDAAKRAFESVLSLDPKNADAHYHVGTIFMMQKDYDNAARELTLALRDNPKHRWSHYQLSAVYEHLGKPKLQKQHLQAAAELGHPAAQKALL